jgi:AraC family transcriptional regulator, regulatory protein of adaptative response / DNA-3-methyladenine glycosylase II
MESSNTSLRASLTKNSLGAEQCYAALKTRDSRFDGRFFVAVKSTRIYCRPVCRVKLPRLENCTFYLSAAGAEHAGYRPCLRCRPELAPGHFALDASSRLAQQMAMIIQHASAEVKLDAVAAKLGVTERHARRLFHDSFGVTPVQYAQTCRLLAAKRLLSDTDMPMLDVAHAAGFRSLRRFNDLFAERYRMQPSALRKSQRLDEPPKAWLEFRLPYRRPFDWADLLSFLSLRVIPGIERVDVTASSFSRHLAVTHEGRRLVGELHVTDLSRQDALSVSLSQSLAPVCLKVLQQLRKVFDLDLEPEQVKLSLGTLCSNPGVRLPGGFSGFEIAVRAVLGQQVSVKGAHTLAGRIAEKFGQDQCFPEPEDIAAASVAALSSCGLIQRRAQTLIDLAQAIISGRLVLDGSVPLEAGLLALKSIKGIGEWTAQYVAMRALRWPDALPADDLVLKKRLQVKTGKEVELAFEAYRPWRAYAVIHTWKLP